MSAFSSITETRYVISAKIIISKQCILYTVLILAMVTMPESYAASSSYVATPGTSVPDNQCPTYTNTTINVPDSFTITDLNVGLNITHTFRNDLIVRLQSPAGTLVELFSRVGDGDNNLDILLDSDAGTNITTVQGNHTVAAAFYENVFTPEIANQLDSFDGEGASGNWILGICDDVGADTGTINRVLLSFAPEHYTVADSNDASCSPAFTDISGTGTSIISADDAEANVTMPFTFRFFDSPSTNLRVGDNGGILFGVTTGNLAFANQTLPVAAPAPAILPFWDDLNSGRAGAAVYVQTLGTTPNRRYVVQWDNIPHFNNVGRATLQAVLFEDSNEIHFVYNDVNFGNANFNDGASATIGLSSSANLAKLHSFNTASLAGISGICYTPTPINDFGDAPSGYGDAVHNTSVSLNSFLGTSNDGPDAETASQSGATSDGDDTGDIDDEDGVTFRSPANNNKTIFADVVVNNPAGGTVSVCGWLDVPSGGSVDGVFDSSDGSCQTTSATNPTLTFQWSNLPTDQSYTTYARFRISSDSLVTTDATGSASDGEVEDYRVIFDFRPTLATIGEVNINAIRVEDFFSELNIDKLDRDSLLSLLKQWHREAADKHILADRDELIEAIRDYLDPDGDGRVAVLKWDTLEERGTIGFYVERTHGDSGWITINNDMLPGLISAPMGGEYQLADPTARSGIEYQYKLIEQEATGATREYGPYTLQVQE